MTPQVGSFTNLEEGELHKLKDKMFCTCSAQHNGNGNLKTHESKIMSINKVFHFLKEASVDHINYYCLKVKVAKAIDVYPEIAEDGEGKSVLICSSWNSVGISSVRGSFSAPSTRKQSRKANWTFTCFPFSICKQQYK